MHRDYPRYVTTFTPLWQPEALLVMKRFIQFFEAKLALGASTGGLIFLVYSGVAITA